MAIAVATVFVERQSVFVEKEATVPGRLPLEVCMEDMFWCVWKHFPWSNEVDIWTFLLLY